MALRFRYFYPSQPPEAQEKYSRLLLCAAHIGRMFSENKKPYIHYRHVENIFCKSFVAQNISRRDLSVDAVKERDGIGIKTFLSNGITSYEKVAEFNDSARYPFTYGNNDELVREVTRYRNERLEDTIRELRIENTLYHYVVREVGKIIICECPMVQIDTGSITVERGCRSSHIVRFNDKFCRYYFHTTKNTLYQEFSVSNPSKTIKVPSKVDIDSATIIRELTRTSWEEDDLLVSKEYVILPLYSTETGEVPERSGLNQWNAGGRERDYDEVYIPIPRIVHERRPNFFPPRDRKFK
ncbi:MAG: restriction endonuclease, partial [Candidatus Brocadiales bacterium]